MPLIRDDEEERRTRIEHMLDQLRQQRAGVREHEIARIHAAAAADALRSATRMSRAARLRRARERARNAQPSGKKR